MRSLRWLLIAVVFLVGCRSQAAKVETLGARPPAINANTKILETFDPSALAKDGAGLGLDTLGEPDYTTAEAALPPPALIEFGPLGDTSPHADIEFRFNRPIAPLGANAFLDAEQVGLIIEPKVEGYFRVLEATRLVFSPIGALPDAHVFKVQLDARLQAVDGPEFEAKAAFSFATPGPEVSLAMHDDDSMRGEDDEASEFHWRARVLVDAPEVNLRELRRHLRADSIAADGEAEPVAIDIRKRAEDDDDWPRSDFEVRPKRTWPAGREVILRVDDGLVGESGPRPIDHEVALSFRVSPGVRVTSVGCYAGDFGDGCDLGPLEVRFSAPVSRAQAKYVHVSPEAKGFDTLAFDRDEWWQERPGDRYWSVLAWGDYSDGGRYRVRVDPSLRDIYGQRLAGSAEFEIAFVEPPPELALRSSSGTLVHSHGPHAGIESRHAEQLRVRVAVLDEQAHERVLGQLGPKTALADIAWPSEGAELFEELVDPDHRGNFGWAATELDLSRFDKGRPATVLLETSVTKLLPRAAQRTMPEAQRGLLQISDLGVSVIGSLTESFVRVADVITNAPIEGAEVELIAEPNGVRGIVGKTDAEGMLALPGVASIPEGALLRVRKGDDRLLLAIADLRRARSRASAKALPELRVGETTRAVITTERALYRPGEVVRAIGWATIAGPYELAGVRPLPAKTKVTLELRHVRRKDVVAQKTVAIKPHGKFWATLAVPADAELGSYVVTASILETKVDAQVEVKDFVAPEFEVMAEVAHEDLHHGEATAVDVNARYYFGGPVPVETMREASDCRQARYRPPGLTPEWRVSPGPDPWRSTKFSSPSAIALGASAERGHVEFEFHPTTLDHDRPSFCTVSVALADQTGREVGAETSAWIHPKYYLAAAVPKTLAHEADVEIPVATLDFDGTRVAVDDVKVRLVRRWYEEEWVTEAGERVYAGMRERTAKLAPCTTNTRAGDATCRFTALDGGTYEVEVIAKQGSYEPKISASFWVADSGDRGRGWSWSSTPPEQLTVEVDNATPKPGDRVRVRVSAPWSSGKGVLILAKGAIHELRNFELSNGAAEFELDVSDAWIPRAELWAVMIQPRDSTHYPRLATAKTSVSLSNESRELAVDLEIPREADAGDTLPIVVRARDAQNQPVRGHVAVWAVDEAVLALAPHTLPNFVDAFTVGHEGGLGFADGYRALLRPYAARLDDYARVAFVPGWTRDPTESLGGFGYGRGSGAGFGGRGKRVPQVRYARAGVEPPARSKFDSAPIFIGDAELDEHGVARLSGELPDNLTTFRVTAIVSAATSESAVELRFGSTDARVRVTRPLIVRAALPRILRPGDRAEVGVLVDNLGVGAGEVEIEVEIHDPEGALELLSPASAKRAIAAGEQLRIPFEIRALRSGTPTFEARARVRPKTGKPQADAVQHELPVEPERTLSDRVAVYGSLADDAPVVLPFALPADADPGFGGLSISISTSLLGGLEDAVAYLVHYPYGCVEQTSSSLLPLIPLGTLAKTYPLGIADVDDHVDAGIERLQSMQLLSGGFGYWPGDARPTPHGSAYALWVLGRAKAAGYSVPAKMLERGREYLLAEVEEWAKLSVPSEGRDIEIALALVTLAEAGRAPEDALARLYERRVGLPMFARTMLLLAIHAQDKTDDRARTMLAELRSFVDEREASARIETEGSWTWYWDSDVRSSALMLMAMLAVEPEHVLVPKLARGLLDARRGGRWGNTQENAYALIALAEYARIHEAIEPDFEGRVWLDRTAITRIRAQGRSLASEQAFTPMPALLEADRSDPDASRLLLERVGVGRMYYRVGLEWASTATDLPARAEGLEIERRLRDEQGTLADDAAIRRGTLLALDVDLTTRSALTHVAIELPLPAGLEAIDIELGRGTAAMRIWGWRGEFVSHQELRRDRAVVFVDRLPPGTHRHTIWLRATTPGDYVMPPASATMMYYPEVYGRTRSRQVSVE